jgi:hypothetical protein
LYFYFSLKIKRARTAGRVRRPHDAELRIAYLFFFFFYLYFFGPLLRHAVLAADMVPLRKASHAGKQLVGSCHGRVKPDPSLVRRLFPLTLLLGLATAATTVGASHPSGGPQSAHPAGNTLVASFVWLTKLGESCFHHLHGRVLAS